MIKRRFYKHEHGDRDAASDPSSSSDSEIEVEEETDEEGSDDATIEVREKDGSCSTSSGYQSEDSSGNVVEVDSSGLLTSDADTETGIDKQNKVGSESSAKSDAEVVGLQCDPDADEDSVPRDIADCVLKCKSVFRCRLCPRIVCLSEETLNAHLKSKRHVRSVKLLKEGRLKLMLNSDGEIEEENREETPPPVVAPGQNKAKSRKRNEGRQRQRKRLQKKKTTESSNLGKARPSIKKSDKKRHKSGD